MTDSFHRSLRNALSRATDEAIDLAIHNAAEKHLDACYEALYQDQDEEYREIADVDDPAYAPFCGCNTCVVREVLTAAWVFLIDLTPSQEKEGE